MVVIVMLLNFNILTISWVHRTYAIWLHLFTLKAVTDNFKARPDLELKGEPEPHL